MSLSSYVIDKAQKKMFSEESIQEMCTKIFNSMPGKMQENIADREVGVIFVTNDEMQQLNQDHRDKDKVTDILSFASLSEENLGELVVALDVIQLQAAEHDLTLQQELLYMLIHGLLHLLGYDHVEKDEERQMFLIQDAVFDQLREEFA